jgi:hypothetical protein
LTRIRQIYDKNSPLEVFCQANICWAEIGNQFRRRAILNNRSALHSASTDQEEDLEKFIKHVYSSVNERRLRLLKAMEDAEMAKKARLEVRAEPKNELPTVDPFLAMELLMQKQSPVDSEESSDSDYNGTLNII